MTEKGYYCAGQGGGGFGKGQGRGRGGGQGRGFGGRGPGGTCVCPACGEKVPHQRGVPCPQVKCPKCGASMVRED
ncbi:MAG: hypothetical protein DRG83_10810 [Deltaproteobacteria bacterium]|nr:MAG: hypothetical protein DRG83_10810 [Deltaproteobacteria bacterium]